MGEKIINPREQVFFLVEETTAGTLEAPTAGDALAVVGLGGVPNQAPEFSASDEIADSRSVLGYTPDRMPAGALEVSTYVRPSGTAGAAPAEGALWKGLLGAEAVSGGVSVTYSPAKTLPTFSAWWKGADNLVLFARGLRVDALELAAGAKGYWEARWSALFEELGWCGESVLSAPIADGATSVPVEEVKRYSVGARVTVGTSAGHEVTAVDYAGGTLTVSPAVEGAQSDAAVVPELPTPTYTGAAVTARSGALTVGGSNTRYRSVTIRAANQTEALTDEVDGSSDYPSAFFPGVRQVGADLALVLRSTDADRWRDGVAGTEQAVVLTGGSGAGNVVTITQPQAVAGVPELGEGSPAVEARLSVQSRATSAGEDELSVVFS